MITHIASRAVGRDIGELFGFAPDDRTPDALRHKESRQCPFMACRCSKTNHDGSEIYGVCSVSNGNSSGADDIVVCPKRMYAGGYSCLKDVADMVWGADPSREFVIGGNHAELRRKAVAHATSVVAFGQGSGNEVGVSGGGALSLDWVLQLYERDSMGGLVPKEFVCVEIQSIDITGNYRDAWAAYMAMKDPAKLHVVPSSGHGLNWANVHKRLIPQLIRKGNMVSHAPRCRGLFFVLPDTVFQKFEQILPSLKPLSAYQAVGGLTVVTYKLGESVYGQIRNLEKTRTVHYLLNDVAQAFIALGDSSVGEQFDRSVSRLLG